MPDNARLRVRLMMASLTMSFVQCNKTTDQQLRVVQEARGAVSLQSGHPDSDMLLPADVIAQHDTCHGASGDGQIAT